jgi:hypothetical protein
MICIERWEEPPPIARRGNASSHQMKLDEHLFLTDISAGEMLCKAVALQEAQQLVKRHRVVTEAQFLVDAVGIRQHAVRHRLSEVSLAELPHLVCDTLSARVDVVITLHELNCPSGGCIACAIQNHVAKVMGHDYLSEHYFRFVFLLMNTY